jgi:predicted DNA-binding protein
MRKRQHPEPMHVTSFRLPPDVRDFLTQQSIAQDRTKSYILVQVMRLYIGFLKKQAEQPRGS